jgi:FtsX-like permease family
MTGPTARAELPPNWLQKSSDVNFQPPNFQLPSVSTRGFWDLGVGDCELVAENPRAWTDRSGATRRVTLLREIDARFATAAPGARAAIATSILGAIGIIVALACLNLATMVMARGAARTHEINVRLALGASRWRLLRQLATESLLIAVAGTAAGLGVVAALLKLFEVFRPQEVPAVNLAIDWRVIGFASFMAIATPLLFGLGPGVHVLRLAIADGLKGAAPLVRRRWVRASARELLLAVQVTVSFGLLVMAAMFARGLMTSGDVQPSAPAAELAWSFPQPSRSRRSSPSQRGCRRAARRQSIRRQPCDSSDHRRVRSGTSQFVPA